jgi:hypothetical protein
MLPPFAAFRDLEPESRCLRLTGPEERVCSYREDKTFNFYVEGKNRTTGLRLRPRIYGHVSSFLGQIYCVGIGLFAARLVHVKRPAIVRIALAISYRFREPDRFQP